MITILIILVNAITGRLAGTSACAYLVLLNLGPDRSKCINESYMCTNLTSGSAQILEDLRAAAPTIERQAAKIRWPGPPRP